MVEKKWFSVKPDGSDNLIYLYSADSIGDVEFVVHHLWEDPNIKQLTYDDLLQLLHAVIPTGKNPDDFAEGDVMFFRVGRPSVIIRPI